MLVGPGELYQWEVEGDRASSGRGTVAAEVMRVPWEITQGGPGWQVAVVAYLSCPTALHTSMGNCLGQLTQYAVRNLLYHLGSSSLAEV